MMLIIQGINNKLGEIEETILQKKQKGTLFDDLYNKLANSSVEVSALQVEMGKQFNLVNDKVLQCNSAEKDNAANFTALSKEVRSFRNELTSISKGMDATKKKLLDLFNGLSKEQSEAQEKQFKLIADV